MSHNSEGSLNKASSSVHAAVNSVAGAAHHAVDRAAGVAEPTAEWLRERSENLSATRKKLVTNTSDMVSSNPLKAVGIAVFAGFVLSRIFR
jgi:ElaB/YqjD/DUF883 family membrane-anchored ribosome-binding protein